MNAKDENSLKRLEQFARLLGGTDAVTRSVQMIYDIGRLDGQLEVHEQERSRLEAELAKVSA